MFKEKRLVLGGAQFTLNYGLKKGRYRGSDQEKFIKYSYKYGFREFDSAYSYNVKNSTYKLLINHGFKISSKLPYFKKVNNKHLIKFLNNKFEDYLKKKKINKLYILYIHDTKIFKNKKKLNLIFSFLQNLKRNKKIDKIGFSIYSPEDLLYIKKNLKSQFPDVLQVPCNYFDRRFCNTKTVSLMKKMKSKIYVRSIFLQGLLLMENKNRPKYFLNFEENLKYWDEYCKFSYENRVMNAINFVKSLDFVHKIIVGFDDLKDLKIFHKCFKKYKKNTYKKNFNYEHEVDLNFIDPRKWQIN